MTTALWLLYLADVVQSVSILAFIFLGGAFCWIGIKRMAVYIEEVDVPPLHPAIPKAMIAAALVLAFLPGKTVIYASAAYYAGDAALQTETGDRAVRALNAWLDRQIAGEEPSNGPR